MNTVPLNPESISKAAAHILAGEVVAHATETCYGLTCDPYNLTALTKLFTLKQRPMEQPVSILVASVEQAKEIAEWSERASQLADQYWPGALTLVLPRKDDQLLVELTGEHPSIGIRQSDHPTAQALIQAVGKPIVTTSANVHRRPETYSALEVEAQLKDALCCDLLVLDEGELAKNSPSTLLDLTTDTPKILRQGDLNVAL